MEQIRGDVPRDLPALPRWRGGPSTFLGVMVDGFPNLSW
jgi:hypothetical protein